MAREEKATHERQRKQDLEEATAVLIKEKKRREENDCWWKAELTKMEDRAKDAEKLMVDMEARESAALTEVGRLERVVIEQAKAIYGAAG